MSRATDTEGEPETEQKPEYGGFVLFAHNKKNEPKKKRVVPAPGRKRLEMPSRSRPDRITAKERGTRK